MKDSTRNEFFYPILGIASVILIIWQYFGMNKRLDAYPADLSLQPTMINDNISGGHSVGTLEIIDGILQLQCQTLKSIYTFAFCSVEIPIAQGENGIDLASYQSLDIWLQLESNSEDTVLVYLLNSESAAENIKVKRANLKTIYPAPGMTHYRLMLDSFFVPSWWLFAHARNEYDGEPNLSNVTDIQIATGDNPFERSETIRIQRIEINGKWLNAQYLYLFLFIVWSALHFFDGLMGLRRARENLRQSRIRATELTQINTFLSIEKDKYESMAKIDPLTNALNRAGLRDTLDHVVQQYVKNNIPCSVIMFDIDHFKSINDQFGHNIGDQVLIGIVTQIKQHIRKDDCLARWGGEEFVLICPNTTFDIAINLAEKHRVHIADSPLIEQPITCSFGVAQLKSRDISKCFEEADIALYKAKNQGRNQVAYQ